MKLTIPMIQGVSEGALEMGVLRHHQTAQQKSIQEGMKAWSSIFSCSLEISQ